MRTRRAFCRLALAALTALGAGCSTWHGRFDFDPAASFTAYRSFAFVHAESPAADAETPSDDLASSQLVEQRVRAALERELLAKGLAAAPEDSAELLVAFNVSSRRASRLETYPVGVTRGWGYPWWHDHWDYAYTRIYTEGLMIVDLIDAKSRKLVWRGWTTDPLPSSGEYDVVDHAVAQVMRNYPPPAR